MIVVLFVENFTDAAAQFPVSSNFFHYCRLERPMVNVKLDDNEVSWLAYAAYYIQRMRSLLEVICNWGVVKVQPAHKVLSGLP